MRRSPFHGLRLYGLTFGFCALAVFPIYWMLVSSLTPGNELRSFPPTFLPTAPDWTAYQKVLLERPILTWLANSTFIALASVALSLAVSILAAYSLSRFRVRGAHTLGLWILVSKMLPATLLVIPLFAMFRELGIIGTPWSAILAHATLIVPFSTWMLKGYFDSIPQELEQAALIDGCSPLGALWRIVLPAAAPGIAATALYGVILSWADYAFARTFLTSERGAWTLNVGIATLKGEHMTAWNEIMAASMLAALPIIAIYLVLERFLVGGLTAGAVK